MNLLTSFKEYLFSQEVKPAPVTVKNYLSDINHFVKWFENQNRSSFNPIEVTAGVINHYKNANEHSLSASSMERHLSSLRKFFNFLKLEGQMSVSPFEPSAISHQPSDPFNLKGFKDHLYVYNSAHLTIKNYIIDVKQFIAWAKEVSGIEGETLTKRLNTEFVEEYKSRLLDKAGYSPATINRKLSSLRRYFTWAQESGLLTQNANTVENIQEAKAKLYIPSSAELEIRNLKLEISNTKYSAFPPLRLLQKITGAATLALDSTLIIPVAKATARVQDAFWRLKGQPVFEKGPATLVTKNITPKDILGIKNISKYIYAPFDVSTKSFDPLQKALFHLRYSRPKWYKTYHSYAITHYFHFAVLIIFLSALGFGVYNSFFVKAGQNQLFATTPPVAPPRILSFQGRLTDNNDNPITANTNIRFAIYDTLAASGSSLLWQEVDPVSPDTDGIFNSLLGNVSAIPSTLFANNAALYLGVTIEATPELTPRQQLATVAFAANSETLQGLLPITNASGATTNVVLALDSSGNLTIGGSANPVFSATGGTFKLSGQPLLLTTNLGSNGNVQITTDALGKIDLQKPLINTSISNNISTAKGSVEVDDLFSVLATSSGQSAFTLNQDSTGPLISASTSGVAKFTVDNSGNITTGTWNGTAISSTYGGTGIDSHLSTGVPYVSSGTWSVDTNYLALTHGGTNNTLTANNGGIVWSDASKLNILAGTATANLCLLSGSTATPSWGSCITGLTTDVFWQQTSGALFPNNSTVDLLFGGQSSASALLRVTGQGNPFRGTQVGASIAANTSFAGLLVDNTGVGDLFTASKSGATKFVITNAGNVGIGGVAVGSPLHLVTAANQAIRINSATANQSGFVGSFVDDIAIGANRNVSTGTFSDTGKAASTIGLTGSAGDGHIIFYTSAVNNTAPTERVRIDNQGLLGLGTTAPASELHVTRPLASGTNGKALALFDQIESQDIFTASAGGTSRFTITNAGGIKLGTAEGIAAQCLTSGGTGAAASWATCSSSSSPFQELSGAIVPFNSTEDLLIGGQATTSAKFAITNINGTRGTQVASLSGSLALDSSTASIQTTLNQTLTIGGNTTGNIFLMPINGAGTVYGDTASNGDLTLEGTSNATKTSSYINLQPNGGNVGIGTTAPTSKLDVAGTVRSTTWTTPTSGTGLELGYGGYANNGTLIAFDRTGSVYKDITIDASAQHFYISGAEKMTINSSGHVGIGNTNPTPILAVASSAVTTGNAAFDVRNTTATGTQYGTISLASGASTTNYGLYAAASGATNNTELYLESLAAGANNYALYSNALAQSYFAGNVGIGIATPISELHVTRPLSAGASGKALAIFDQIESQDLFTASAAGASIFTVTRAGGIALGTNGLTYGTSSQCLLGGSTAAWGACTAGTAGSWWTTSSDGKALTPINSTMDLLIGGQATTSAKFAVLNVNGSGPATATVSGNLIVMPNNGAGAVVGIGMTSPMAKLDIRGGGFSHNTSFIYLRQSGGDDWGWRFNTDDQTTGDLYINAVNGTSATQKTALTMVRNNANIGIGTTTPTSELNVTRALSAGALGKALVVFDQIENQDILTASFSGTPRFTITNPGGIKLGTNEGVAAQCLTSGGTGAAASWTTCTGTQTTDAFWNQTAGALTPNNSTVDLLIGGQATTSALFAFTGMSNLSHQTQASFSGQLIVMPNNGFGGNVGIGTTSPLPIGTGISTLNLQATGTNNTMSGGVYLTSYDATTLGGGLYFHQSVMKLGTFTNQDLMFHTNGTERMRITNAGLVGIGTTSPLATLDVRGQSGTLPIASFSGSTSFAGLLVDNTGVGDLFTASKSGATKFVITNAGNVGIGTTAPEAGLSVQGTESWGLLHLNSSVSNGQVGISFKSADDTNGSSGQWMIGKNQGLTGDQFSIYNGSGGNKLTIDTSGNVGIGNITPLTALDVTGSASLSANLSLRGAATAHTFNILDNGTLNIQRSPGGDAGLATALFIQNNGNVGIGTTAPGTTFNTIGSGLFSNQTGNLDDDIVLISGQPRLAVVQNTASIADNLWFVAVGANAVGPNIVSAKTRSNQTDAATIVVNGDQVINISGSGSDGAGRFRQAVGIRGEIDGVPGSADMPGRLIFSTTLDGASSPTDRMTILNNGNVGIGTATPLTALDVTGSASLSANLSLRGAATAHTFNILDNGTLNIQRSPGGDAGLTTALFIQNSGNVGIGTTAPTSQLQVESATTTLTTRRFSNDASGAYLEMEKSRSGTVGTNTIVQSDDQMGGLLFGGANGTGYTYGAYILGLVDGTPGASNDMPGRLAFYTTPDGSGSPAERMRITSAGNFGIGTTAPIGELHVTRALSTGATGKALAIFDQIENQDILTASAGGVTKFKITNAGNLIPGADNTMSIGSSPSARFKDLFLGPGSAHIICTTGDGCGAGGLDYALGVNTSTGTFSIGVNGTTATGNPLLNITQGGNVGIGDTSPDLKLDVLGYGKFGDTDGDPTPYDNGLSVVGSGATSLFLWESGIGSGHIGLRASDSSLYIVNTYADGLITNANYMALSTTGVLSISGGLTLNAGPITLGGATGAGQCIIGGTTASWGACAGGSSGWTDDGATVRLTTAGDLVGIGTASPSYPLHVKNTTATVGSVFGTVFFGQNNTGFQDALNVRVKDNITDIAADYTGSGDDTNLTFSTRVNGSALSQKMGIGPTGLISLGTTTLSSELSVSRPLTLGASGKALAVFDQIENQDIFTASAGGTTKFVIANDGSVAIGGIPNANLGNLQVLGTSTVASVGRWGNHSSPAYISMYKSRGATVNSTGIVQANDQLGIVGFAADDGTGGAVVAARIVGEVDGTPGTNDMPGRLNFLTTPDGSATALERMRVDNTGKIGLGTSSPTSELYVTRPLSFGVTGKALAIFDQIENQDILTASKGGVAKFVIDTNGNVAIGTPSAAFQAKLTVFESGNTINTWKGRGLFGNESGFAILGNYQDNVVIGAHNQALNAWKTLYLNTSEGTQGGDVIMKGNVGIGTNGPLQTLDVRGSIVSNGFIRNWYNAGGIYPGSDDGTATNTPFALGTNFSAGNAEVNFWNANTSGASRGFEFLQKTGASAATSVLRILGSGAIQLGGSIGSAQCLLGGTPASWGACAGGASGWTDDGTVVRLTTASDTVGIGTTAPAGLLHLYSTANGANILNIDAQGTQNAQQAMLGLITLGDGTKTSGNPSIKGWFMFGRGNAYSAAAQQNDLFFSFWDGTNFKNTFWFDSVLTTVGLGTATPISELHVTRDLTLGATGKALAIFDQTENQDIFTASKGGTTKFVIDNSGDVLIGATSARTVSTIVPIFQVEGTSAAGSSITAIRNSNDTNPVLFNLAKSRGTTLGSNTVVQNGDVIGAISFFGADGTDLNSYAGYIRGIVDGTPGTADMPGALTFGTTLDGASSSTERLRITNTGLVGIGTTSPISELHVTRPLSFGATGKALAIFDQIENQDILTASAAGASIFTVTRAGGIALGTNGLTFGTATQCLLGGATAAWGSCATGVTTDAFWNQTSAALFASNSTVDLLIGGQATTSAKFAVLNIAVGTPVASVSSGTQGLTLRGDGVIQSVRNNTLTIGGDTTGNIKLSPNNAAAGGKVIPGADNLVSLGATATARFKDIFVGPSSLHVQCVAGDGCNQGTDYDLGINTGTGDLTVKSNNVTQLFLSNSGSLNARSLIDLDNSAYFIDPAASVTAMNFAGTTITASQLTTLTTAATLGISATTLNLGAGSAATLGTVSDDNLNIAPNGTGKVGVFAATPLATLDIRANSATVAIASVSGSSNFAGAVIDQTGNGDIFTASRSGASRFTIAQTGNITQNTNTTGGAGYTLNANSLTTGTAMSLLSTSTALSSGGLMSLYWNPSSSTIATGDLLSLDIGANGVLSNIFNVKDNGSTVFSVSQTAVTSNLPAAFTAPGDVSIAYDINFTNPTASYIKSAAPLTIQAGEQFNSSDLNISTFNKGRVEVNTEALEVTGSASISGSLGIGTTTPTAKLDVSGGVVRIYAGAGGNYNEGIRVNNADNNYAILALGGTGISGTGADQWTILKYGDGTNKFGIRNNGTDLFNILTTGNVGIGITAPVSLLDVQGGSANWSETTPGLTTGSIHLDPGSATDHFGSAITWGASDSSNGDTAQAGIYVRSDGSYGTKMYFATTDSYAAGSKVRMMIDSTGNVGIGQTSPGAKLQVTSGDASYAKFGPNTTWGGMLYVGAGTDVHTTSTAQVIATDGNLHLDAATSKSMYLNYYNQSAPIHMYGAIDTSSTITAGGLINATNYLQVNSKYAIDGTDSYLRLNQQNSFTSGIYTPYNFRADGTIYVGGTTYYINSGTSNLNALNAVSSITGVGITSTNGMTVGNGTTYTSIVLKDDESPNGVKYIHANSNLVGFLTGAGGWDVYADDSGNWNTATLNTGLGAYELGNVGAQNNAVGAGYSYTSVNNDGGNGWPDYADGTGSVNFNSGLTTGSGPTFDTVYTGNWFRSSGTSGWYNSTYGVGVYATTGGRVDIYNGASLYVPSSVTATKYIFGSTWTMGTAVCANAGVCWDKDGTAKMSIAVNGVLRTTTNAFGAGAPDIAEYIKVSEPSIESGDIVISDSYNPNETNIYAKAIASKANKPYQSSIIGGISENPDFLISSGQSIQGKDLLEYERALSIAGRIPVKVSTINGDVHVGDAITSSEIPGVGMKATRAGTIVGIALTDFDGSDSTQSAKLVNGEWQTQNSACQANEQDCYNYGKVLVFINPTWHDPDVYLTSTGDLDIIDHNPTDSNYTIPHYFTLNDALGNPIDRIGAFSQLISADIQAGSARIQQLSTNSLAVATGNITIAGQSLQDFIVSVVNNAINNGAIQQFSNGGIISPIASIDVLHTNLISPLAGNSHISVKLDDTKFQILNTKYSTGSAVASFDNQGNATFSGSLAANNLTIDNNATIGGTLRVSRIIADQIEGLNIKTATLAANYITNNYYSDPFPTLSASPAANYSLPPTPYTLGGGYISIASFSSQLAYVENLDAANATFSQGLTVYGSTTLSDTSIVGQLAIGGSLILADNSINVLGSDLKLQPLRQGGISIMSGLVYIDTDGNIKVGGNVTVDGTLYASTISPKPGKDLVLELGSTNQESGGLPHNSSFIIHDSSHSGVFSINNLGDIVASGAATISKLNLNNIVSPALAVSPTEVIATGSAGTGKINANRTEMTINNPLVTEKSLIYITPSSNTNNQVLYLLRQVGGESFTVGIQSPSAVAIPFNWIIVN